MENRISEISFVLFSTFLSPFIFQFSWTFQDILCARLVFPSLSWLSGSPLQCVVMSRGTYKFHFDPVHVENQVS
jgi:hypothetical protein